MYDKYSASKPNEEIYHKLIWLSCSTFFWTSIVKYQPFDEIWNKSETEERAHKKANTVESFGEVHRFLVLKKSLKYEHILEINIENYFLDP